MMSDKEIDILFKKLLAGKEIAIKEFLIEAYELGKKHKNPEYSFREHGGSYFYIIEKLGSFIDCVGWKGKMNEEQAKKIAQYYVDVLNEGG